MQKMQEISMVIYRINVKTQVSIAVEIRQEINGNDKFKVERSKNNRK